MQQKMHIFQFIIRYFFFSPQTRNKKVPFKIKSSTTKNINSFAHLFSRDANGRVKRDERINKLYKIIVYMVIADWKVSSYTRLIFLFWYVIIVIIAYLIIKGVLNPYKCDEHIQHIAPNRTKIIQFCFVIQCHNAHAVHNFVYYYHCYFSSLENCMY